MDVQVHVHEKRSMNKIHNIQEKLRKGSGSLSLKASREIPDSAAKVKNKLIHAGTLKKFPLINQEGLRVLDGIDQL